MNFFLLCYSWSFIDIDWQKYLGKTTDYCNFMYDAHITTIDDIVLWEVPMDNECFTICIKQ